MLAVDVNMMKSNSETVFSDYWKYFKTASKYPDLFAIFHTKVYEKFVDFVQKPFSINYSKVIAIRSFEVFHTTALCSTSL